MAAPVLKSKTMKEEVVAFILQCDRRGFTLRETQVALLEQKRVNLSYVSVSLHLKRAREGYRQVIAESREEMVREKLDQYREIRREAWAAWERSQRDAEKTVTELVAPDVEVGGDALNAKKTKRGRKGRFASDVDPGVMAETLRRLKVIETREGRLPANAYLQTIMDTLAAERELLGLDAPTKVDARAVVANVEARSVDWAALSGRPPRSDVLAEAIEAEVVQPALPAAQTAPNANGNGKGRAKR